MKSLKPQLKTGQLVRIRSGEIALVMLNTPVGDILSNGSIDGDEQRHTWMPLDALDDDLKYPEIPLGDIVEIYTHPIKSGNSNFAKMTLFDRELIFKRDD